MHIGKYPRILAHLYVWKSRGWSSSCNYLFFLLNPLFYKCKVCAEEGSGESVPLDNMQGSGGNEASGLGETCWSARKDRGRGCVLLWGVVLDWPYQAQ